MIISIISRDKPVIPFIILPNFWGLLSSSLLLFFCPSLIQIVYVCFTVFFSLAARAPRCSWSFCFLATWRQMTRQTVLAWLPWQPELRGGLGRVPCTRHSECDAQRLKRMACLYCTRRRFDIAGLVPHFGTQLKWCYMNRDVKHSWILDPSLVS